MKLFANGDDQGTIRTSLFKHYQWIVAGPFASDRNAMSKSYPPEKGVSLRHRYQGAIGPISWMPLPPTAYLASAEIDLTSLLPHKSVAYLYTVIQCESEKQTGITFYSGSPAAVVGHLRFAARSQHLCRRRMRRCRSWPTSLRLTHRPTHDRWHHWRGQTTGWRPPVASMRRSLWPRARQARCR